MAFPLRGPILGYGHAHWFGISLKTAGGFALLQLPSSSKAVGSGPHAAVHASCRGTGHALTHLTHDEQAVSLEQALSWLQQF
jgi:hypothetical protein